MHGISTVEHKEILRERDWREEEFEAGFQKGVVPRDGSKDFLEYEALVRRELAKGEVSARQLLSSYFCCCTCVQRIVFFSDRHTHACRCRMPLVGRRHTPKLAKCVDFWQQSNLTFFFLLGGG